MTIIAFPIQLDRQVALAVQMAKKIATLKDGSCDTETLARELVRAMAHLKKVHGLRRVLTALAPYFEKMTDAEFVSYGRVIRTMAKRKLAQVGA